MSTRCVTSFQTLLLAALTGVVCTAHAAAPPLPDLTVTLHGDTDRARVLREAISDFELVRVIVGEAELNVSWHGGNLTLTDGIHTRTLTTTSSEEAGAFVRRVIARTLALKELKALSNPGGELRLSAHLLTPGESGRRGAATDDRWPVPPHAGARGWPPGGSHHTGRRGQGATDRTGDGERRPRRHDHGALKRLALPRG